MTTFLFDEATIKERYEHLYDIACTFCDKFNEGQQVHAEIDPSLLYLSVVSIYDDIARYKAYHLTNPYQQKSNPIKRAAFSVKWLMHFSPIIFPSMGHVSGGARPEDSDVLANAIFAMHFALTNVQEHAEAPFNLKDDAFFEILYDLLYRSLGSDALMLYFHTICELARNRNVDDILD